MQTTAPDQTASYRNNPATEKQVSYIRDLLGAIAEHDRDMAMDRWITYRDMQAKGSFTIGYASDCIAELKEQKYAQRVQRQQPTPPVVPTGRYAIPSSTEGQDLAFYRVLNESGHYKVWVYASSEQHRVSGGMAQGVLRAIEKAGFREARVLFGQEMGECYDCGRALTDRVSRELGIGPVCREKG